MPRTDEYICPRCHYSTTLKKHMRRHLYELKNPCTQKVNLILTDEIREHVLINHRYQPEEPKEETTISVAPGAQVNYNNHNHNHNVTNLIAGMECFDKLSHLLQYHRVQPIDINDLVEKQHIETVKKLESDQYRQPYLYESDQFLEMVDDMVRTNNTLEEINLLYDETLDRIKIWCDGEWTSYFMDAGLRRIVEILRTNCLNTYECYLYRKNFLDREIGTYALNNVRLKIEEYYKFLYIFDHHPLVYMEPIEHILPEYRPNSPDEFCDYGMKIYSDIKENMPKMELAKTKRTVIDIIKRNHKLNMKKLNESILELISVDNDFHNRLMKPREVLIPLNNNR